MKKSLLILTGVAMLALVSCSKEQTLAENGKAVRAGIGFRASIAQNTRAVETTTSNLNSFYVCSFGETEFSDVEFTKGADNFYTSVTEYPWPDTGELSFFAYAPSKTQLGGTWTIRGTSKRVTNFRPKTKVSEQLDFVIASATGNKATNETSGVALNFTHALSQISVLAMNTNADITVKVKGVRIGSIPGTATLNAQVSPVTWTVSNSDTPVDYQIENSSASTLTASPVSVMGTEGSAMLIPQQLIKWDVENDKSNDGQGAYLAVYANITKDGKVVCPVGGTSSQFAWVAVPIDTNWEPGKKYTYTLDLANGGKYAPDDPNNPGEPTVKESEPIKFTFDVTEWTEVSQDLSM